MLLRRPVGVFVLCRHLDRIDTAHISRRHPVGRLCLIQRECPAHPPRYRQQHGHARRQRQSPRKPHDGSERPRLFAGLNPRPNAHIKISNGGWVMAPRSEQRFERIRRCHAN